MPPIQQEPVHKFCESTNVVKANSHFALVLHSGGEASVFIFTPDHLKQVMRVIEKEIAEFEKINGPLKAELPNERLTPSFINLKEKE